MDVAADGTFPLFRVLLPRFPSAGIREGDGLQQGVHHAGRDARIVLQQLQKCPGVLALGEHVARLAAQILRHQAAGLLHRRAQRVGKLGGEALRPGLALDQATQRLRHCFFLGLLGRHFFGNHRDCGRRAGIRAGAAADAPCRINDAVLCVGGPGGANIQAQAVLGTKPEISHRILFRHDHILLSARSNFQPGTLHTGQSSGGASPT